MSEAGVLTRAAPAVGPPPVGVVVALCPSQRSVKSRCRRCVERCPLEALEFAPRRFTVTERCNGCGVCYAACPTGAVELPRRDDRALGPTLARAVAVDPGRVVRITCERAGAPPGGGVVLPCLGRLTENLVLAAVAEGAARVEVRVPACEGCPMARGMAGFEATLELAGLLCRLVGRPEGLAVVDTFEGATPGRPVSPAEVAYSRREFLRAFRRPAAAAVADALPETPAASAPSPAWREASSPRRTHLRGLLARFAGTVPIMAPERDAPFAGLRVTDNCVGCNVCEAVCPTGALTREETGRSFALLFEPWKCTGCGVCATACYTRAIRLQPAGDLGDVLRAGREPLIRFAKRHCEICGQPSVARGETLCFTCQKRRRLLARVFGQPEGDA